MSNIRSLIDLYGLVDAGEVESSILEFKSSRIFSEGLGSAIDKLSYEVSAMANSIGGTIVIGMEEDDSKPARAKEIRGTDNGKISSEWLAQKLETKVYPKIYGIEIITILDKCARSCFIFRVPASFDAPHQSCDHKYYARRQFQKIPMEHFEIEDIRNRKRVQEPKIAISLNIQRGAVMRLEIKNMSKETLFNISFVAPAEAKKALEWEAHGLVNGITALASCQSISYFIGSVFELFKHECLQRDNEVCVVGHDASGKLCKASVVLNLLNYKGVSVIDSDAELIESSIMKGFTDLSKKFDDIKQCIESHLRPLTTNTGLSLSQSTLQNIRMVLDNRTDETRWTADHLDRLAIQEIFGFNPEESMKLEQYFRWGEKRGEGPINELTWLDDDKKSALMNRLTLPEWCKK